MPSIEALITAHYALALHRAMFWLHDVNDARDAVQDAMLRAWRYRDHYDAGRPFRPWLMVIVKQCSLAQLQKQMRREGIVHVVSLETPIDGLGDSGSEDEAHELPDPGPSLEDLAVATELLAAVQAVLAGLPSLTQRVAVLRLAGYGRAEIAARLCVTTDVVEHRMSAAYRALRAALKGASDV